MGTSIIEVADLFTMLVSDYRLDSLYITSGSSGFNTYLEGWLLFAIGDFSVCNQDLAYSTTTQTFTETLTQENINILAQLMVKFWMQKLVQDILQTNSAIQDHDYKTFSAAANLKEKQNMYNAKREELSQLLNDYAFENNTWSSWNLQIF